ncbi:MAG: BlaI/MecI/CopY family transcriptional regulator [Candidatus Sumerlaeia bacterium]|nr:BlaI/MecI/CopY family transcriptional regulator [Candidatus Sumerlaeia bacterium]
MTYVGSRINVVHAKPSLDRVPAMPPESPLPTDFELEILQELWRVGGPATVRQVHEALSANRPMVYTTVLKAMQVMHEKGIVRRDESERAHRYLPSESEQSVKDRLVSRFMKNTFADSAAELAMRALSVKPASSDELRRLHELLDEMDDNAGKPKPS